MRQAVTVSLILQGLAVIGGLSAVNDIDGLFRSQALIDGLQVFAKRMRVFNCKTVCVAA